MQQERLSWQPIEYVRGEGGLRCPRLLGRGPQEGGRLPSALDVPGSNPCSSTNGSDRRHVRSMLGEMYGRSKYTQYSFARLACRALKSWRVHFAAQTCRKEKKEKACFARCATISISLKFDDGDKRFNPDPSPGVHLVGLASVTAWVLPPSRQFSLSRFVSSRPLMTRHWMVLAALPRCRECTEAQFSDAARTCSPVSFQRNGHGVRAARPSKEKGTCSPFHTLNDCFKWSQSFS